MLPCRYIEKQLAHWPRSRGIVMFLSMLASPALADSWNIVLRGPNGYHIPKVIGASGSIDSAKGFTGFDYFEWFGITHHRNWFKPTFSPLNPTGNVTDAGGFNAAMAAIRANPLRQGTHTDVYFDWERFNREFDVKQRYIFQRFEQLGIVPMMVDTVLTDQDPLVDWGNRFKYWKQWYAYAYFFACHYNISMFEIANEPHAGMTYTKWESHWLVAADAVRKAIADVNAACGKHLKFQLCGPTEPGPYWDYRLPDPKKDVHGWGSTSWGRIHTDISGRKDPSIWNYGMYDYHKYSDDGATQQDAIKSLRNDIAKSRESPNVTMPILISEYNTSTGGHFESINKDTEDIRYGIGLAQILQGTATLGPAGLGDEGGFFLFKLGSGDASSRTLGNKTAYVSALGEHNYGGVTRGGACFQLYAHHFRGGKPVLGYTVGSGANKQRRLAAVWDQDNHAYYLYFSNMNGTNALASFDLGALDVKPGSPVTVARVDTNNTGQITDCLTLDPAKKLTIDLPDNTAVLAWIPQGNVAAKSITSSPVNDTYLTVGGGKANHGAEPTLKVSLHHAAPGERRIGFLQFSLSAFTHGNRFLLKLPGHSVGTSPMSREILHVYGAGSEDWSETSLTWAAAPGVGKYFTDIHVMAPTTGLGSMVDIEDNHGGVTSGVGQGLGLHGKFLGPVSYFSSEWATNYVDVTDYVKSLIASKQTRATFVISRVVRYNVNQYSSSYYKRGDYECDGRVVEFGTKENPVQNLRPSLVVWNQ